ncbi:hypothetical protein SAMN05444267_10657 [Chryseobacterium polytrichastri]|uniref:YD repeat-containing protein n=2 Tax=Chryseobacterium polytrichastri TaxID=1302687 RepID=A0A1M7KJX6_9FLAO|nr:hypothetical protein SAMN05444267_10657 [Chryseobacterium polytrichastri]
MSVGNCPYPYGNTFGIYSSGNFLPVQKTQGSDVGYQNITVSEKDKGKTEYSYTSPIDKPNPLYISPELPPFLPVDNYDYKRGLLTKDEKKNNMNINLYKKDTEYNTYDTKILTGVNVSYINSPYSEYVYAGRFNSYENYVTNCIQNQQLNPFCGSRSNVSSMMRILPVREIIGKANPNHSESIEYFNGNPLKATEDIIFNTRDYPIKEVTTHSDSKITETNYQYAHEKADQRLISANMIGIPLETSTIQKKDANDVLGKLISKTETKYDNPGNLFPSSELSYDILNNIVSTEVSYDKYDEKGNLLQYTTKLGTPVTIVWGYNNTQPIAQIEGITYDQLTGQVSPSAVVSASDEDAADPSKEGLLLDALTAFRKNSFFADKKITTYTYDPLIGVTSITAPTGVREIYLYDSANRLKEVKVREKDSAGNYVLRTVKQFNYNYKP